MLSLPPLALLAALLFVATLIPACLAWRAGRRNLREGLRQRVEAKESGSFQPRLEHPWIDISRCIGCASCMRACPEEGVLDILHGQAAVVHGSRCIGHGECAAHCPVGAIALTMADRKSRNDLPALLPSMQAHGVPGLYLAGEVTGYALIRTAVDHGRRCANAAWERKQKVGANAGLDLCIVGAGPGGLACALEAKRLGLDFVVLEQDRIGGTIARYPRSKLLNTHPLELPLGGRLEGRAYHKEELMKVWMDLCTKHQLPIQEGEILQSVHPNADGKFSIQTQNQSIQAQSVCLAIGRRGIPNKLNVVGEELMKVNYSLIDARAFKHGKFLIVGGGDSAVEAALGLAEQPGNQVHISYRRAEFFRLRSRSFLRIQEAIRDGKVKVHWQSNVHRIEQDRVLLKREDPALPLLGIPNDEVFVLIGGLPPLPLLQEAGVSFDPNLQPKQELIEKGSGLVLPLAFAAASAGTLLLWGWWHSEYYQAEPLQQIVDPRHSWLRSASGLGLVAGILASIMILTNLTYLLRRNRRLPLEWGSLNRWMSLHIATGLMAFAFAILHSSFSFSNHLGGHTLLGIMVLVSTGGLGRYFYSFVPRAANGREQALESAQLQLMEDTKAWGEVHRDFGEEARRQMAALIDRTRWKSGVLGSILGLVRAQLDLRKTMQELIQVGRSMKLDAPTLNQVLKVARKAHRDALIASHFESLRTLLASWRFFHRWVGLLVVLLLIAHVVVSLNYADLGASG
ncbi:MAG: NAD(P)-binding domain-containing protein [Planctomycetes bacterium]|nr:NAD(P)-binding domain-containing protein [Planctomycetota bacterium]